MELKKLENYIPLFNRRKGKYLTENNGEEAVIILNQYSLYSSYKVNNTVEDILELCDGTRSLEYIFNSMIKLYEITDEEVLKNDLLEILFTMSKLGIVKWKNNESPFDCKYCYKENDLVFRALTDYKIFSNSNEIKNSINYYSIINPYLNENFAFDKLTMQRKSFQGNTFYSTIEYKNEIILYLIIELNGNYTFKVNYLGINKDYSNLIQEKINCFLGWQINWIKEYYNIFNIDNNVKFYLFQYENSIIEKELLDILNLRFVGKLDKEMGQLGVNLFEVFSENEIKSWR